MSKKLFVVLLSLLTCAPSYAGIALDGAINAAQEQMQTAVDLPTRR
jgi:hypothetical protein